MKKDRLAKLEEKRVEINAEIKRVKTLDQKQKRLDDTRRQLLVGALVLSQTEREEDKGERLLAELDSYLHLNHDRALFGLPPKQQKQEHEQNTEHDFQ